MVERGWRSKSVRLSENGISPIPSQKCCDHRYQLPILPAFARTPHSLQGYTAEFGVVIDVGSLFFAGDFVAISRAKELACCQYARLAQFDMCN